jgi:L-fucose isomerase-like protein
VEQELLELFDDTTEVTATQTKLFSALIIALREFASEGNFGALALKCWGDIVESYGIAGCGSGAVLNDSGLITACEGDVMGAITMFIAQRISGIPSFLTDLVAIEREDNRALLWHIGCAPLSLANPRYPKHLFSHFAGGKGVTAGFALKPGRITLLRLGDDGKNLRMIAATGTALETEMELRGTVLRITLDGGTGAFLDEMLSKGWEHHVVATYGDIVSELDMLCRTLQIPLTIVK